MPQINSDLKRILVFRIGHLGDTIVAIPAFNSIRDAFPDAEITLLSNSDAKNPGYVAARNVLPEKGLFDSWIVYSSGESVMETTGMYARLLRKLRSGKFDAVFYLMTRNRTAARIKRDRMFFRAAGISEIIGDRYLMNHLIDPARGHPLPTLQRESDFFLEMLADAGISASRRFSDMRFTHSETSDGEKWLASNCGEDYREKRIIAIAPGSKWESKVWKEEHFVDVTSRLVGKHGVYPVVFGGPEDRPKGERILSAIGTGSNAAGELNVRNGAAAMRHAALFLGNDTGTMHMAAAAGAVCVAVFAAIDFPGRWYPFGEGHKVFRAAVECEGCHTPDCFNGHLCLRSVTPDEVFDACDEILSSR